MILPIRSKNPPESFPIVTILLIVINIAVYALTSDSFLSIKDSVVKDFGLTYAGHKPITFLTSMFLHANLLHLLGNMWFLYLFGFAVEGRLRSLKFLVVYLLSGLCGDLLHLGIVGHLSPNTPSIGASGAIMGVMGAAIYMFPHAKIMVLYYWSWWWHGIVDWNLWVIGLIYVAMDVFGALLSTVVGGGVAHLAHLGGVAGGFLACFILRERRDDEFTSEAKATLDETKDLSLLSPTELHALYDINPTDHNVIMHWMGAIVRGRSYSSLPAGTAYSAPVNYNQPLDPRAMNADMGFMNPTSPQKPAVLGVGSSRTDLAERAFLGALPKLAREQPPMAMFSILQQMPSGPGSVPSYAFYEVGSRLESEGHSIQALQMYEYVLRHPQPAQQELEAAMFRSGVLCEGQIANFDRSAHCYREILRAFPMSTFADNARVRLENLERTGRVKKP